MNPFIGPKDFDVDGFAEEDTLEALRPRCSRCQRYMPRLSTMLQCRECQEYFAKREENLKKWGLLPQGVNIEIKRRVA